MKKPSGFFISKDDEIVRNPSRITSTIRKFILIQSERPFALPTWVALWSYRSGCVGFWAVFRCYKAERWGLDSL